MTTLITDTKKKEEALNLIERLKPNMDQGEYDSLKAIITAYYGVAAVVKKGASVLKGVKEIFFGKNSEKTKVVIENAPDVKAPKPKAKGHGRKGAKAFKNAEEININHPDIKAKDICPECSTGKLYPKEPATQYEITGNPPLVAKVYKRERFRCSICGKTFTAPWPDDIEHTVYDETAIAMIVLLKYGFGTPYYRLEKLQHVLDIPLSSSTQWDLAVRAHDVFRYISEKLCELGANAPLIHNDDTSAKILSVISGAGSAVESKEGVKVEDAPKNEKKGKSKKERKGIFTTGIVCEINGIQIVIYKTGIQHSGENMKSLLEKRKTDESFIQMCDGSSNNNLPESIVALVSNCLAHGRRKFVELYDTFPEEVKHVLIELGKVYQVDKESKTRNLSPQERLHLHQEKSRPVMDELAQWLQSRLDQHIVEDNSQLGSAIRYMLKRWDKLTLFLRKEGAPLDNNICERILKIAILNRKNAMFFKTLNGAKVGDTMMSLIATCQLQSINPFDYFVALLKNADQVKVAPQAWLPWNYRQNTTVIKADAPQ